MLSLSGDLRGLAGPGPAFARLAGRLTNSAALAAELGLPAPVSPEELVLACYRKWGTAFPSRLEGSFAAAVHDPQAGRAVLARDRLGTVPLYYREFPGGLAYSGRIKDLLAAGPPAGLDFAALGEYLTFQRLLSPATLFGGIRRLPAGHALSYSAAEGRAGLSRYWDVSFGGRGPAPEEAAEACREALTRELGKHADVGFSYLSAGLDSASLALLLRERFGRDPLTFTAVYDAADYEEGLVGELCRARGLRNRLRRITAADYAAAADRAAAALEEPPYGNSAPCQFLAAEFAAASGCSAVFSGHGGDELFGGYPSHLLAALRERPAGPLLAPPRAWKRLAGLAPRLAYFCAAGLRHGGANGGLYVMFSRGELQKLLRPAAFGRLAGADLFAGAGELAGESGLSPLERAFRVHLKALDGLLTQEHKLNAAHGIRPVYPYCGEGPLRLLLGLRRETLLRGLEPKGLQRLMLAGLAPRRLLDAPKQGFPAPLAEWNRADGFSSARAFWSGPERGLFGEVFDTGYVRSLVEKAAGGSFSRLGAYEAATKLHSLEMVRRWFGAFEEQLKI